MNPILEFSFVADTFNLAVQDGEDTERTARELDAAERDKAEADKRQLTLTVPQE